MGHINTHLTQPPKSINTNSAFFLKKIKSLLWNVTWHLTSLDVLKLYIVEYIMHIIYAAFIFTSKQTMIYIYIYILHIANAVLLVTDFRFIASYF